MSLVFLLSCSLVGLARCSTENQDRGCNTSLTRLNGTINSPTPPKNEAYIPEYTCKWNIELWETSEPRHVELQFTRFNLTGVMPNCSGGDYVEFFLGCYNSKSIGKFCGQILLPVVYSPDHCLQILFHVFMEVKPGPISVFEAVFNQRLLSRAVSQDYFGCGKDLHANAKHGNIFSPHWPLPYPRYVDCVWHVTTRPGLHVKLVFFDFDVRSSEACAEADFVEVKTGDLGFNRGRSMTKSKECGTKAPFALTIDGDSIFIQFKSQVVTTGNRGFMAGFVVYNVEDQDFKSHVLILLGVIFFIIFALVGKAFLQKLIEGNKLNGKSVFQRFRRRSKTTDISPIVVPPCEESDEPGMSADVQGEKPSTEPATREVGSPSKSCSRTVKFETVATRDKRGSVNIVVGEKEPEITGQYAALTRSSLIC